MRHLILFAAMLALGFLTGDPAAAADEGLRLPLGEDAALACAAARYRGEALAIQRSKTPQAHEVRWLTPAGNVLRIRLVGPGCRFLEISGVGQAEARILP